MPQHPVEGVRELLKFVARADIGPLIEVPLRNRFADRIQMLDRFHDHVADDDRGRDHGQDGDREREEIPAAGPPQQSAARAVYVADQETPYVHELYGVATHGVPDPIKLNSPLAPGEVVSSSSSPYLSADGLRAVFMAGFQASTLMKLFSVATDGGAAPVLLSGSAVAGGGVSIFRVSADGTRVAYVADQDIDETRELYGTLADGSIAPVKLHPPLAADRDVFSFDFASGGARVVYVADQDTRDRLEGEGRVAFRYCSPVGATEDNPNGSIRAIASAPVCFAISTSRLAISGRAIEVPKR